MAKPPLSMKPTGWFQVAWSDEIGVGDVHTMKYFDQEMVAWRARVRPGHRDERLLRTPRRPPRLRRPRRRRGDAVPVPRLAVESARAATSASRTRTGPTAAAACAPTRWSSATSRSTSGTTSRAASRSSTRPTSSPASATAAAPTTTTRSSGCSARRLELHPQYVLENGVDFAHFKFVHKTPIVPVFTRHDFDEPVSYVDFTITFEGDDGQKIEDVNSGVEAINGGLGIAVTKSWGMVDNRTISAITPVDESTSDVRFMVYIGRDAGQGSAAGRGQGRRSSARRSSGSSSRTSTSGRTSATPTRPRWRAREYEGFTAIRKWAKQFYPDGSGGSAAEAVRRNPERLNRMNAPARPIRVFQVATGNVGSEMIKRIADAARPRTHWRALLFAGEGRPGRR